MLFRSSLVANDGIFIKEQFSIRHFRRDRVMGLYLDDAYSTNESSTNNDTTSKNQNITDDNVDDDNIMDSLSPSENDDDDNQVNMTNTKPLSRGDLKRIFDEILGSYDRCSDNVKFTVCSLSLSIKEISNSDGRSGGLMHNMAEDESFNLELSMRDIINKHKNSFIPSEGAFLPTNANLLPSTNQMRKATSKRLKSKREQTMKKVKHRNKVDLLSQITFKKNVRVKRSCTFCGSNNPGENVKNCVKRKYLQRTSKEYMIGKNGNQLEDFLRKVEFDHIFSHQSTIPTDVYTELTKARGKQIFVYKIWRPKYATTLSQFQFNDMIFQISYVNHQGDVKSEKISVTGKTLHSILCARN